MSERDIQFTGDKPGENQTRPDASQAFLKELQVFKPALPPTPEKDNLELEQILNGSSAPLPHTRILADNYGRVKNMALMLSPYPGHLEGDKRTQMLGAFKTLFTEMEPDTKFTVVVETDKDRADVEKVISDNKVIDPKRISFLKPDVGNLTIWTRDMMIGMYMPGRPGRTAILNQSPLHDWHLSDRNVPGKIAAANPRIRLDTQPFIVSDGGDVISNRKEAFMGYYSIVGTQMRIADAIEKDPALKAKVFNYYKRHFGKEIVEPKKGELHFPYIKVPRTDGNDTDLGSFSLARNPAFRRDNLGTGKVTEQQALEDLAVRLISNRLDKPLQVMGRDDPKFPGKEMDPASDHLDMACTPIDEKTFLVGDPSLAKQTINSMTPEEKQELTKMLSDRAGKPVKLDDWFKAEDHQKDFDAYTHLLENKGYKVLRVPYLEPAAPGDPYFSYNNCLMERFEKDGKDLRRVFLPHYGVKKLDDLADKIWKSQSFEVHPVPLDALSAEWGALRCITNWLDRKPRG